MSTSTLIQGRDWLRHNVRVRGVKDLTICRRELVVQVSCHRDACPRVNTGLMCVHVCTLSVMRHVRNFLLSPMTITLLRKGISLLIRLSMGTGGMFSPPDVMISSEGEKRTKLMVG